MSPPSIDSSHQPRLAEDLVQTEGFRQVRQAHRYELIEDYLELIDELIALHGRARQVQIAERLGVAQPTVARMLKRMGKEGYLLLQPYKGPLLTPKGRALADASRQRHRLIEDFLRALGVDEFNARRDAEGLEHHASEVTLAAFRRFLERQGDQGGNQGKQAGSNQAGQAGEGAAEPAKCRGASA